MKVDAAVAIIPARYNSTRLPGKPLAEIEGKPLIEYVYRRVEKARLISGTAVATDDPRIAEAVERIGGNANTTPNDHPSGTDRLAGAVHGISHAPLVVYVQGDEPVVDPADLDRAIAAARTGSAEIVT